FVALAGAMLLPALSKSKSTAQSVSILNNLRQIDGAKQQWALENSKPGNAEPTMNDLKPYLGRELASIAGEKYVVGKVGEPSAADLQGVEPRHTSRTWSLVQRSARESDQRVRLLADGRRVSADKGVVNYSPPISPSPELAHVQQQPLPTTPTAELVGMTGQSRSGGIFLPSSANFDNKQNLPTVPIPSLVGVVEPPAQSGGGGGGGGGA